MSGRNKTVLYTKSKYSTVDVMYHNILCKKMEYEPLFSHKSYRTLFQFYTHNRFHCELRAHFYHICVINPIYGIYQN